MSIQHMVLLQKLKNASTTCHDCGTKHGVAVARYSTWHDGRCDVCGKLRPVTEARNYGYFKVGIQKLRLVLEEFSRR